MTKSWIIVGPILLAAWAFGPSRVSFFPSYVNRAQTKQDGAESDLVGSASCSGRGCHGGLSPDDKLIQRNEYTTIMAHDKHAQAYAVLLGDQGKRIAKNLTPPNGQTIPAHEDPRCLACHVTPELALARDLPHLEQLRREGVGCEACHGPAKKWLESHVYWYHNKTEHADKKGLSPLWDLKAMTQICAGCHVGAPPADGIPARDLNHDLMAAGHPRLMFELTSHLANMPPHWNVALKHYQGPDIAKAWAIGQIVSAQAALNLLKYRVEEAQGSQDSKVATVRWPEFAEYNCFACHADLHVRSWRRDTRKYPQERIPGALPFNTWFSSSLDLLPESREAFEAFQKLTAVMQKPLPPFQETIVAVAAAQRGVDRLLPNIRENWSDSALQKIRDRLAQSDSVRLSEWDDLMQSTLAAGAISQARKNEAGLQAARDMASILAFPKDFGSPKSFHPPEATAELEKHFARLLEAMKAKSGLSVSRSALFTFWPTPLPAKS